MADARRSTECDGNIHPSRPDPWYDSQIPGWQAKARSLYYYVYVLRSKTRPDQTYVGSTTDLRKRLAKHNPGKSIHTNKFKPWNLLAVETISTPAGPEVFLKTRFGWLTLAPFSVSSVQSMAPLTIACLATLAGESRIAMP